MQNAKHVHGYARNWYFMTSASRHLIAFLLLS